MKQKIKQIIRLICVALSILGIYFSFTNKEHTLIFIFLLFDAALIQDFICEKNKK